MSEKTKLRDSFSSRTGFILACIGSAVGMGNIWRFPMLVSKYGGLSFILPYLFFVVVISSSGIMEEFALGRAAGSGPMGAFGMCTQQRWGKRKLGEAIGAVPVLGSLGLSIGYTVVFAWIVKYTWMALMGDMYAMGEDMDVIGGTFGATASAFGANWWIVIGIVIAFFILAMGIAKGIEVANKLLMPILFALFVCLGVYTAVMPGAGAGYRYIFTFNGPITGEVLVYAFGQAFFSLSVAGNGSVIYGSYLSKKENIPHSARMVAVFDTLAALLAAMVIVPAMAAADTELSTGGPGLMFIYLVRVLNHIVAGRAMGVVFFVAVTFAGLSSIINLYEAPIAMLQEKLKLNRVLATGLVLALGCTVAIFIQAVTSEWMDVISIYICPIGALLAAVMFFWVAEKQFVLDELNLGAKKPVGKWFYPMGKYVYCLLAWAALIAGAILGGIG